MYMVVAKEQLARFGQFASDNTAGICPRAWQAMNRAGTNFALPYGDDFTTEAASDALRELFEIDCQVFFCFNGTAANSMALAHLCRSYHSVIAHSLSHIETHECGGPEFFSQGTKLLLGEGVDGKLSPDSIEEIVSRRSDIHYPKPRVVSLTQSTETGTCYSVDELQAIGALCKSLGLSIHMDGARFANAVARLQVAPKSITWQAGVDVLCFGGTKNGMAVGEAVVFFDKNLAREFDYRCKQAGQLASKMRFLAAPWQEMLSSGDWLDNARQANRMAQSLGEAMALVPGISLAREVEVNAVFLKIEATLAGRLRAQGVQFYDFIGENTRWMCSWATTDKDIQSLVKLAHREAEQIASP